MVQGQTRTSQIAARFFCCLILGFLDLQMYSTIMGGKKSKTYFKKTWYLCHTKNLIWKKTDFVNNILLKPWDTFMI